MAREPIDGFCSLLPLAGKGVNAARDTLGQTPPVLGRMPPGLGRMPLVMGLTPLMMGRKAGADGQEQAFAAAERTLWR